LSSGLTSIGSFTFFGLTGLTSITIPAGVTSIGEMAFNGVTRLERVSFMGDAPTLGLNVFREVASATAYRRPGTLGWGAWNALPVEYFLPAPLSPTVSAGETSVTVAIPAPDYLPLPDAITVRSLEVPSRTCTMAGSGGTCTITGLVAGATYTFVATTSTATPAVASADSAASTPVTLRAVAPVEDSAPVVQAPASAPAPSPLPVAPRIQAIGAVAWASQKAGQRLGASFTASPGTAYAITATLQRRTVTGACRVASGRVACSISLKSAGKWMVVITPKKSGRVGVPVTKTINVR
jgi:hypothetical protein